MKKKLLTKQRLFLAGVGCCLVFLAGCNVTPVKPEKAKPSTEQLYFNIETNKWYDSHGACNTCTPENGFPIPPVKDGFYYNVKTKKWHDRHGPCNTCTLENGFPANPKTNAAGKTNTGSPGAKVMSFAVGPKKVDCVTMVRRKCLVVNGSFFYNQIQGFNFQEGYQYRLKVERTRKKGTVPADASPYNYKLLKVVSKKKV